MGPLPALLEQMGGACSVDRSFAAAGLPIALLDDMTRPIPLASMFDLFRVSAREAGDPLFGLRVGLGMRPQAYGILIAYALEAPTLRGALQRVGLMLPVHQTGSRFGLVARGGVTIWRYHTPDLDPETGKQHSDHVLPGMIGVVRAYLGPAWMPRRVFVPYRPDRDMAAREDLLPAEWHCSAEGVGVGVELPTAALDTRSPDRRPAARSALTACAVLALALEHEASGTTCEVEHLLELTLLDGRSGVGDVALLARRSARSVQRALQAEGTTFREVLERVRMRRARALLRETDIPITQIALSLGYEDPSNFSRAFRRAQGHPPAQERRLFGFALA